MWVHGTKATYLGDGYLHETEYNHMVHQEIWQVILDPGRESSHTSVRIGTEFCPNLM